MKFDREILEMLPCIGNVFAQFETDDGIDLVPVAMFARCITYFNWDDDERCDDCENCSCCCDDERESEELVIPMVVMNDDEYVSFADEHSNYVGLRRA